MHVALRGTPACNRIDAGRYLANNNRMRKSYGPDSTAIDLGLLLLRLSLGINLFLRHGLEKITHYSHMSAHFPDPIHIGSQWSLLYALLSDAVCSVLIVLGLGTRVAAFIVVVNLGVVFSLVHHFGYWSGNGELVSVYFGGFLALVLTGAGRFSLDEKLWGRI